MYTLLPNNIKVSLLDASTLWVREPDLVFDPVTMTAGKNLTGITRTTLTDQQLEKALLYRKAIVIANANSVGLKLEGLLGKTGKEIVVKKNVNLLARIPLEGSGKVLDVSLIKDNGTGARVIETPKGSSKVGSPGLRIISNNYAAYALAISMLEGDFSADLSFMRAHFGIPDETVVERVVEKVETRSEVQPFVFKPQEHIPVVEQTIFPKYSRQVMRTMYEKKPTKRELLLQEVEAGKVRIAKANVEKEYQEKVENAIVEEMIRLGLEENSEEAFALRKEIAARFEEEREDARLEQEFLDYVEEEGLDDGLDELEEEEDLEDLEEEEELEDEDITDLIEEDTLHGEEETTTEIEIPEVEENTIHDE